MDNPIEETIRRAEGGIDSNKKINDVAWRVLLWGLGALVSLNTLISGWSVSQIMSLQIRMAATEATRWTAAQHASYAEEHQRVHSDIRNEITRIPNEVPPRWFLERVNVLERKVEYLAGLRKNETVE